MAERPWCYAPRPVLRVADAGSKAGRFEQPGSG